MLDLTGRGYGLFQGLDSLVQFFGVDVRTRDLLKSGNACIGIFDPPKRRVGSGLVAIRCLMDSDAGKNIFGMKHRSGDLGSLVGISLPGLDEGDALERLRLHPLVFDRVSELQSIFVIAKLGALNGDGDQKLVARKRIVDGVS